MDTKRNIRALASRPALAAAVIVLAGCGTIPISSLRVTPPAPRDWVFTPVNPGGGLLGPADGDQPGNHTWRNYIRFGAHGAALGHPGSMARSGEFQCGNPVDENRHCTATFTVHTWLRDNERIRVRLRRTAVRGGRRVITEVSGYVADSGRPLTYSISYPACSDRMEVIFDWDAGRNRRSIASRAYIGRVQATCARQAMTNRAWTSHGGRVEREAKLKDSRGRPLPPALEPRRVLGGGFPSGPTAGLPGDVRMALDAVRVE
ncbi:MAG: hypothetical protein HKN82_04995 [Akkermansiaceae bacterium]|nr:hypothetical protein [Akkermansiaceae bacterium]